MEKESTSSAFEHEHGHASEEENLIDISAVLKNFIRIFLRRIWVVILSAIICGGIFGARAYFSYSPYYESKAIFAVSAGYSSTLDVQSYSTYYDTAAARQVVNTFSDIISTEAMYELICQSVNKEYINASITASLAAENSNLFALSVKSSNPSEAYAVILAVIDNYPRVAASVLGGTRIYVIEEPYLPAAPVNERVWRGSAVKGAILGGGAVCAIMLIIALSIHTVSSQSDLKNSVSIKCLGELPYCRTKKRTKGNAPILITDSSVNRGFAETVTTVRTRLLHHCGKTGAKIILITSTVPGEGKTTLAANLAISLAQGGARVILADADLRLQSLRGFFGLRHESRGLADALNTQNPYIPGFLTDVGIENLKVITGASSAAPFKMLHSKNIRSIFEKLRTMADYVIVDTPPCGVLSDAEAFIRYSDGVIYMIKADYAPRSKIIDNIQMLSESHAQVIGYVLGGVSEKSGYGYGYGYNYKGYGYGGYGKNKGAEK